MKFNYRKLRSIWETFLPDWEPTERLNMTKMRRVFTRIEVERERQHLKFNNQSHLPPTAWAVILGEEYGEVCKEVCEGDAKKLKAELVQVAAVAVAWLESME